MTRANQQVPENPAEKPDREAVRDKRRAEELRANLKRRKAQLRGRAERSDDKLDGDPESAGEKR